MTAAERRHMERVRALGCLICHRPAAIHHVRRHGEPRDHLRVLPLCPTHHQHGGHGVAIHAGREEWERVYGTEEELLDLVDELLSRDGTEVFGRAEVECE